MKTYWRGVTKRGGLDTNRRKAKYGLAK